MKSRKVEKKNNSSIIFGRKADKDTEIGYATGGSQVRIKRYLDKVEQ